MNANDQKLIVIDVMPLLYRGHFAFINRPRLTASGTNTSAIYIFTMLVRELVVEHGATHVVLAMDTSPTFRHEKYPEYKAKREKLPEDIGASIPMAEEFAQAMNIPFLRVEGFEADDLMGTLALMSEQADMETWLVTPDKDIAQLVSPKTLLCRPAGRRGSGNEFYDVARVCEEWGLQTPIQMVEFLGVAGDASDNIPGIPGVGPKTAKKLLADYSDVESIIAHASELKGKLAENVTEYADQARLSRWLAEIRRDVPLDVSIDDLKLKAPDEEAVKAFCAKYELASVLAKIFPDAAKEDFPNLFSTVKQDGQDSGNGFQTIATVPHKYILCDTEEKVDRLVSRLNRVKRFAFDTETNSVDARHAKLVGLSFCMMAHEAYYVPVSSIGTKELVPGVSSEVTEPSGFSLFDFSGVSMDASQSEPKSKHEPVDDADDAGSDATDSRSHPLSYVVEKFSPIFSNTEIAKIGHNVKFDLHVLRANGIEVAGALSDSMLAHYVFDPVSRHGMDPLAREYLNYDPIPITALIGERGKDQMTMDQVDIDRVAEYAAEDADITFQLHDVLIEQVKEQKATPAFEKCENPLIRVLFDMESAGVCINTNELSAYSKELEAEIFGIEQRVFEHADEVFNVASNQQLGKILFDKLKLPPKGNTPTGQYATGEEVLQELVGEHPIINEILAHRACSKLKSTYVDALPLRIDPVTGRVHTSFNQALTETGRLSSDNPNLQNIPIRTERGRRIRAAFVARDDDHVLMAADYSQIELRIMASMSEDEGMIDAFANDADIHLNTASRVYGVEPSDVSRAMRAHAKMVNFGIIYGISAFGLAQRLGISRTQASELIKAYFDLYPGVKRYMEKTVEQARKKGYVETLMGRKRPLRDINSRNGTSRSSAERNAINTPIQGSAADMIKLAMVVVYNELVKRKMRSRLILQVHDELVFDVPREEAECLRELVKLCMTEVMTLKVPIKVDIGIGDNWLEAH